MPNDPIERLKWVNAERVRLDAIVARALFDARLQGRFDEAQQVSGLARKPALALTRRTNESLGRQIRWGGN